MSLWELYLLSLELERCGEWGENSSTWSRGCGCLAIGNWSKTSNQRGRECREAWSGTSCLHDLFSKSSLIVSHPRKYENLSN